MVVLPPKGDVIVRSWWLGLILAVMFLAYTGANLKKVLASDSVNVGDLVARVILPVIILVGSVVLHLD